MLSKSISIEQYEEYLRLCRDESNKWDKRRVNSNITEECFNEIESASYPVETIVNGNLSHAIEYLSKFHTAGFVEHVTQCLVNINDYDKDTYTYVKKSVFGIA
jgi:uncharacterized protein YqgV (UPF0045/DUF77 family)